MEPRAIDLRRLWWVGPATIAAAVFAVVAIQSTAAAIFNPLQKGLGPLHTSEPAIVAVVCVSIAVLVFAAVAYEAVNPVRTYRRIALGVLLVSFVPDLGLAMTSAPGINLWPLAGIFAVMHVVAWAITVSMLTGLTFTPAGGVKKRSTRYSLRGGRE